MTPQDQHDRLVDLLLSELVGKESPPDVRDRVLAAADRLPQAGVVPFPSARPILKSLSSRSSAAPKFAIAAILTLLGVAGVLVQHQQISNARTPTLVEIQGDVDHPGGKMGPGESLKTGPQSSAVLKYEDGTTIELDADSSIVVAQSTLWNRAKGLELLSGKLEAEVSAQPEGDPMIISSVDAHSEVLGTRLSVHINGERTRLEVSEGAVHFASRKHDRAVLVEAAYFAESGKTGFRHEKIPVPGITRFTLMNAESDLPLREEALLPGETIHLASLPTQKINIRADFEGDPPDSVQFSLRRHHGYPTGLEALPTDLHSHPPFFIAGDYWADGRPEDCAAWTPPNGLYHLAAQAIYADADKQALSKPLKVTFRVED